MAQVDITGVPVAPLGKSPTTSVAPVGAGVPAQPAAPPAPVQPSAKTVGDGDTSKLSWFLTLYLIVFAVGLLTALIALWPTPDKANSGAWLQQVPLCPSGRVCEVSDDARLLLIVLVTGALGSFVHAATSFATFVGNRGLVSSWTAWYALRPFIGMALALVFYFAIRGGLLSTSAESSKMSPYGVAAVAGLVGMFSKQASDKLREVFDNLFRTADGSGDDARGDKLQANVRVDALMIPRQKITGYKLKPGQTTADVMLTDLCAMLGGAVTRVPVFNADDAAICVIHQSLLYQAIAKASLDKPGAPTAQSLRLADFLADPESKRLVQDATVFVAPATTVFDARKRMQAQPHCQDIFITADGLPTQKVLGWLTDAEVLRDGNA